jgi:hypothetical protein
VDVAAVDPVFLEAEFPAVAPGCTDPALGQLCIVAGAQFDGNTARFALGFA